jgi:hypothetical protein
MPQPEVAAGSDVVLLSPGAIQHPDSTKVQELLQQYFSAINNKQYDQWAASVDAKKVQQTPEPRWLQEFSSTKDSDIRVADIQTAPANALRIMLAFTSTQDLAHAPTQLPATCVRWRVAYLLVIENGGLRLDATVQPGSVAVAPCK